MRISPITYNTQCKISLGTIEGTSEELHKLRDAIDTLLKVCKCDPRTHTQPVYLNDTEGLMVRRSRDTQGKE